jgi:transposase InsO family protein
LRCATPSGLLRPALSRRSAQRATVTTTRCRGVQPVVQGRARSEQGTRRSIEDLAIAVAEYIDWFNHGRLHGEIGLFPPVEFEDDHYRHNTTSTTVGVQFRASTELGTRHCGGVSSRSVPGSRSWARRSPSRPTTSTAKHRYRKPTLDEQRDEELKPRIAEVHPSNYGVYGARKVWLTLNRQRPAIDPSASSRPALHGRVAHGRDGSDRRGPREGKRTTIRDPKAVKPLDPVDRNFAPLTPDRPWAADLGWSMTTTMTSQVVVHAGEQAIWSRGGEGMSLTGLIAHHDHGVQYMSVVYCERLDIDQGKPLDRSRGLVLRERPGRVRHRTLHDRTGQASSAIEGPGSPRARDHRVGRQVQPSPPVGVLRRPNFGRGRRRSLRSPPPQRSPESQARKPPDTPGWFSRQHGSL